MASTMGKQLDSGLFSPAPIGRRSSSQLSQQAMSHGQHHTPYIREEDDFDSSKTMNGTIAQQGESLPLSMLESVGSIGSIGSMDGMMDDVTMASMVNAGGGGGPAAVISAAAAYNNANAVANAVNGRNSNHIQPRQRRKVPEGEPCAVCCDRATGYHYGVASCNGCKTFFRRTIVSEHTFVCQYNGNCDVNKNVRCACRHCRFNKCLQVGMDAKAIQNDRDRIGPTKKFRLLGKRTSSFDDDVMSRTSFSPTNGQLDDKIVEHLIGTENLCNRLRNCLLGDCKSVKETLISPSLLYQAPQMEIDPQTEMKDLYPASMNDIQTWNIRELRLCLEWAKTFELFARLTLQDQFHLLRNFSFTFNILNRVYYSHNYGPDKIVYPNGAYILRQPQEQVRIPGCRSIYHRQMDEIMTPFRKIEVTVAEFAAFKACLLFNPDACDLSPDVREEIGRERTKYMNTLFHLIIREMSMSAAVEKFSNILMMAPSIQNIIDQNEENMQVMEVFGNFWRINAFVKELCVKRDLTM